METRTNPLARLCLLSIPAVLPAVAVSVFFLDKPIALAIQGVMRWSPVLNEYAGEIPDLLLPIVLVLSTTFWVAWFLRVRKGFRDDLTRFFRLGGTVLPASFLAKSAFKFLFGRIETRVWLRDPVPRDFHWLHAESGYSGFPSGHMTVFTALAAACWICFPRHRTACLAFLLLLGSALVLTNHHFLGDVIFGGYLGLAVSALALEALEKRPA